MNDVPRCEVDLEEMDYEDWSSGDDDQGDVDELLDELLGEEEVDD